MQSSGHSPREASSRKKILISLPKPDRRPRPSLPEPSKQLPQLLTIAGRCFDYYDKFRQERLEEQQRTQAMFAELLAHLADKFREIYQQVQGKETELRNKVIESRRQFGSFYAGHYEALTAKIQRLRQQKQIFDSAKISAMPQQNTQNKYQDLSIFARTINQFHSHIECIQNQHYPQKLSDILQTLHTQIQKQSSWVLLGCGHQIESSAPAVSFSFNNDDLVLMREFEPDTTYLLWQQFRSSTEQMQSVRQASLAQYKKCLQIS